MGHFFVLSPRYDAVVSPLENEHLTIQSAENLHLFQKAQATKKSAEKADTKK